MTEHSPGPWKYVPSDPAEGVDCWWIMDAKHNEIASVHGHQKNPTTEANARLVAASPRMYDFIKRLAENGDQDAAALIASI